MADRTLFYRCACGQDAQSVDSWYLVQNDDCSCWVEHSWSHHDRPDTPDIGSEMLSIAEVLLTIEDIGVLGGFRAAMEGAESKRSMRL